MIQCVRRFIERITIVIIAPNGFACLPRANTVGKFSEKLIAHLFVCKSDENGRITITRKLNTPSWWQIKKEKYDYNIRTLRSHHIYNNIMCSIRL